MQLGKGPRREAAFACAGIAMRRDDLHRHILAGVRQGRLRFERVHVRHLQIENHHLRRSIVQRAKNVWPEENRTRLNDQARSSRPSAVRTDASSSTIAIHVLSTATLVPNGNNRGR